MMAITICHTVLCLTTETYAEVQFRKMSQSFEGRLTAGRGIINGSLSRDSFVLGLGAWTFDWCYNMKLNLQYVSHSLLSLHQIT